MLRVEGHEPYRFVAPCPHGCGWATWHDQCNRRRRKLAAQLLMGHRVFCHPPEYAKLTGRHPEVDAANMLVTWDPHMLDLVQGKVGTRFEVSSG